MGNVAGWQLLSTPIAPHQFNASAPISNWALYYNEIAFVLGAIRALLHAHPDLSILSNIEKFEIKKLQNTAPNYIVNN